MAQVYGVTYNQSINAIVIIGQTRSKKYVIRVADASTIKRTKCKDTELNTMPKAISQDASSRYIAISFEKVIQIRRAEDLIKDKGPFVTFPCEKDESCF